MLPSEPRWVGHQGICRLHLHLREWIVATSIDEVRAAVNPQSRCRWTSGATAFCCLFSAGRVRIGGQLASNCSASLDLLRPRDRDNSTSAADETELHGGCRLQRRTKRRWTPRLDAARILSRVDVARRPRLAAEGEGRGTRARQTPEKRVRPWKCLRTAVGEPLARFRRLQSRNERV